jgi:hypothetical protein
LSCIRTIEQTWHSQPVARGKHVIRDNELSALPAETFEMRKHLLTLALLKPRKNAEAILKSYRLFIYGDVSCTVINFVKICQKLRSLSLGEELNFHKLFLLLLVNFLLHMKCIKIYQYIFAYNYIYIYICTHSFSVSCVEFDAVHVQTKFRRFPTLHKV